MDIHASEFRTGGVCLESVLTNSDAIFGARVSVRGPDYSRVGVFRRRRLPRVDVDEF